ncbi:MAG: hypothetical protein AAGA43_13540 [Bacteroidota bacterium]
MFQTLTFWLDLYTYCRERKKICKAYALLKGDLKRNRITVFQYRKALEYLHLKNTLFSRDYSHVSDYRIRLWNGIEI